MNEFSRADAALFGKRADALFCRHDVEGLNRCESVAQFAHPLLDVVAAKMFVHRFAFVLEPIVIDEVVAHLIGHLPQCPRALLMQLDQREDLVSRC